MPIKSSDNGQLTIHKSKSKFSIFNSQFSIRSKGFTLVELLVVISIIAILASIGLATYTGTQVAGRDAKRKADVIEIQKAAEQYYLEHKSYPDAGALNTVPDALQPYFSDQNPPTDPSSGNKYSYVKGGGACTDQNTYNVCAGLENKRNGNRGIGPSTGCEKASDNGVCDPTQASCTAPFPEYCVGHISN